MNAIDVLVDGFSRIDEEVEAVVAGLDPAALTWRPDPEANTIAWLLWHLSRVQDDHIADVADTAQVWRAGNWPARFGLPPQTMDTGYGHGPDDVAAVQPDDAASLLEYHQQVAAQTRAFLATLQSPDLDRIVDTSWDPPVSLGTRLVSVLGDDLQHVGQAAYLRGLYERAGSTRS